MWRSVGARSALGLGTAVIVGLYTARLLLRTRKRSKITRIIDMIEELQKPSVAMRNSQRVEEIVCQLIRGGGNKLQVIADFDYTISRYAKNGTVCETCHGALSYSKLMPKSYQEQTQLLYKTYHPIEIDPDMTLEDKAPFMREWWGKSHGIFAQCALNRVDIERIIRESNVHLRCGTDAMMDTLQKNSIPLLIFSAGLGDLLKEVLKQQAGVYDVVTTVANFMEFNSNGIATGFVGDLIHCCNKDSRIMKKTGYFDRFPERTNVILMGDSLGDLRMIEGFDKADTVLKIGFLNEKIADSLEIFKEEFDIVLVNDQSMDVVNGLLRKIL